ncbi:MAG: TonB-dependent receptor [Candidatus Solibacter usitatus]|nr:TonB-dependent receptor [Candidatus Solibacter usitatus]
MAIVSILLFTFSLCGQEFRGTIGGMVADKAGAPMSGVKVEITNVETGITTTLSTNDSGNYLAPLLPPARYRIAAAHPGFKKHARSGVTLGVNENLQIDIALEIGDASQSVTVTDEAPAIETVDASLGISVSARELTELPLAHGNPYALIALAPGTTFEGDQKLNRPFEPTNIVDYSMSGSASGTTDITLDGVSNTSKGSNGRVAAGYVPPVDAIGEVRIMTSAFDARAGQTSGGLVNISLRSGTNQIHGGGTYTKMRPEWFANDFFANRGGIPRGVFNYDRWSGSVSGPLTIPKLYSGRNKTFFMYSYEGLRDRRPRGGSTALTVPTEAERGGDFSGLLAIGANYQIYNPFTRRQAPNSSTRYQQDPFPENVIPRSMHNPVALKTLAHFAPPIDKGTTVDHRNNFPQPNLIESIDYYTHIFRIDHNFTPKNRLFVRGNLYQRNSWRQDYFDSPATGLRELYQPRGASLDDVYAISPGLVLNLRYGYTRFTRNTRPVHGYGFDITSLGFPQSLRDAIPSAFREFPVFNISGYFSTVNVGEARFMDTHSMVAAFTHLKGKHTLDFGGEARAYRQSRYDGNTTRSGNYIFDSTWTRGPLDNSTTAPTGQSFAAFLLGLPAASSYIARNGDIAEQSTLWSGYLQDTWRAHRKVTLTLGLRYEIEGPLTERFNRSVRDFDFVTPLSIEAQVRANYAATYAANPTLELPPGELNVRGGLVFAGVKGAPRELWSRYPKEFMPRFGLAWSIRKNTVFRGGFGLYFNGLGLRRTDVIGNGFNRNTSFVPTQNSGLSFYSTLSNPFPDGILEPVGAGLGTMTDVGNGISFFTPNPVAGYNQRWQASLQRQFGRNMVLEAAYVGNKAIRIELGRDLNIIGNDQLSRSPVFDAQRVNYLSANIANPFFRVPGVNGTLGSNAQITRENLLKPFPQFTSVNEATYQGYGWYHSLQMRASRRFSTSLGLNGSYTWAKNMQATNYQNPADPAPYRSLSGADRKHRIALAAIYEIPVGRRRKLLANTPRLVNGVIGGWQMSAIYIYQSGIPLTWGDAVFFGVADDIHNGPKSVEQWFNTGAGFTRNTATRPQSYHYRSWPYRFSNVRGPAMNNVDLSLNKRWRIGERKDIQVRGEGLNAFNRTQFGNPNTDQFSTAFGQISGTANYARQIQAVVRVGF